SGAPPSEPPPSEPTSSAKLLSHERQATASQSSMGWSGPKRVVGPDMGGLGPDMGGGRREYGQMGGDVPADRARRRLGAIQPVFFRPAATPLMVVSRARCSYGESSSPRSEAARARCISETCM